MKISLDCFPFLNVILCLMLFFLINNSLFFATGITIDLPNVQTSCWNGSSYDAVLTVLDENDFIFEGKSYNRSSLKSAFKDFVVSNSKLIINLTKIDNSEKEFILLVKCDSSFSVQNLIDTCSDAKNSGFDKIQIAGNLTLSS